MSYIVSADWLKKQLDRSEEIVLIDTRYDLHEPSLGKSLYLKSHLPGAIYFDLKEHLSGQVKKHGGSHPLPEIDDFAKTLGEHGIDHQTTVVIYDAGAGMYAARAWWMIHYMGHQNVYILDGGFNEWVNRDYPVTDIVPSPKAKDFKAKPLNIAVHLDELKDKLADQSAILIDSRSRDRYLGKEEPLYSKAGHIPGATHYFWEEVFTEAGLWKDSTKLTKHFSALKKSDEIIVSCGSGVSACPNIVALKMAGYKHVRLYPGSFSDWISYDDHPVETKDES